MSDQLGERQDHVIYAIWIGLVIILATIAIDYQIDAFSRLTMLRGISGVNQGVGLTGLAVPCGAYLLFRLVRPFQFTVTDGAHPQNLLYWIGTLLVTLVTVVSVTFLAWIVFYPVFLLRFYRVAGLVLPLATIVGFMFIEASLVRKGSIKAIKPPYIDAGLLSVLMIVPGLLYWFIANSQQTGIAVSIRKIFLIEMWQWLLPVSMAAAMLLLWWISSPLRRKFRRSRLYRSLIGALWVFGLASFLIFAVISRSTAPPDLLYDLFGNIMSLTYSSPISLLVILTLLWLVLAGVLYAMQRKGVPQ